MKRAVIICSYIDCALDIPSLLREDDLVICLDGGYDIAREQGLVPNILMGDFDSLKGDIEDLRRSLESYEPDRADRLEILQYPPEKDYTDLELALRYLDPSEYPEVLVIGGIGGRLDQTAINLQMITTYSSPTSTSLDKGFKRIEMMDGRNRCFALHGAPNPREEDATVCRIPADKSSYLSLIPMTEFCEGVTLVGTKYPLDNATLRREASLTVSNEFEEDEACLSLVSGSMLIMICRKKV